jgi:hypothetical protein
MHLCDDARAAQRAAGVSRMAPRWAREGRWCVKCCAMGMIIPESLAITMIDVGGLLLDAAHAVEPRGRFAVSGIGAGRRGR